MSAVVVIAISNDLRLSEDLYKKIETALKNIDEYEIHAINDKNKTLEAYAQQNGIAIKFKSCSSRIGAKQIISQATHFIAFWSGYDLSDLIFFAALYKLPTKIIPIALTTVANKDADQAFDVYIGRGSPLGNPFPIEHGTDADRAHVIERYRQYFYDEIITNPEKLQYLRSLKGLRLGCHCKPLACHGDIIADYINNALPNIG